MLRCLQVAPWGGGDRSRSHHGAEDLVLLKPMNGAAGRLGWAANSSWGGGEGLRNGVGALMAWGTRGLLSEITYVGAEASQDGAMRAPEFLATSAALPLRADRRSSEMDASSPAPPGVH